MRSPILTRILAVVALVFSPAATAMVPKAPVADAAMHREVETVRTLLRDGADVNAAQGDGMTALHWAALNGDVELIRVLLYAGAVVESTTRLGRHTPLHVASREGQGKAVAALLEAGSNSGIATSTGVRAIHLAAQSGDTSTIRALLEHGADVDARDTRADRTPLMFATAQGRTAAVEALLASGADLTLGTRVVDYRERAATDAIERRRRQRVIEAAQEPNPDEGQEHRVRAPRQAVAQAAAATPNEPDAPTKAPEPRGLSEPDTPTKVPNSQNPDPLVKVEKSATAGAEHSQVAVGASGGTAARQPEPRALSYNDLVGKQGGMTPLHYAARDGQVDIIHLLLKGGANVNHVTVGDGSSPLLIAIINGNFDLAMMLLEVGADPNLVSEDEAGPLFATLNNEWALRTWYPQPTASKQQKTSYLELMEALLRAGADPNARVSTHIWYAAYNAGRMGVDFSGATAFWRAAYATDVTAMRLLLSYGADPNIRSKKPPERRSRFDGAGPPGARQQLETPEEEKEDPSGLPEVPVGGPSVHPLHAASGVGYGTSRVGQQHRYVPNGWIPAVRYLVEELGVDVNIRDHEGYSPLHNAAARGDNALIKYLVGRGADIMVVSRSGQTTVDMANSPHQRVQPYPKTIALLEGLGAENSHNCSACD